MLIVSLNAIKTQKERPPLACRRFYTLAAYIHMYVQWRAKVSACSRHSTFIIHKNKTKPDNPMIFFIS